ncbi:MAG: phage tail protein [Anaerovoracaceae bacterium]
MIESFSVNPTVPDPKRSTVLTYAGLTLLAKCQTGKELHFTRVVMGDGKIPESQNLKEMTSLVSEKIELPILSIKVTGVGTTLLETELKNNDLAQGFFAREVGIFAKDPDTTDEILYAVRNTGDDSEYIPAGGGSEVWNMIYDLVTVVDNAENISAVIGGDVSFVTRIDFNDHKDDPDPHINFLRIGKTVDDCTHVFVNQGNRRLLDDMTIDKFQTKILGGEANTIPALNGRLTQLELETANISLALTAQQIYPDYNMMLSEDFVNPDKIDTFLCKVTSVVAGDNGIDVDTLAGIITGSWYTISDGVNSEYFQVKSCIKNGTIFRILANKNLVNTYRVQETVILRSTAEIGEGYVNGSGDKRGFNWNPTTTWKGVSANVSGVIKLDTSQSNADAFMIQGNITFTESGLVTLEKGE